MSIIRLSAGRASSALRNAVHPRREAARRRSRPRLEPLEGRLVLSGPGATLDVSTAPYFLQAKLAASASAPEWNPLYGESLAITPDGDVLAVTSTIRADTPGPAGLLQRGVVEIWERSGREWSRTAILTPPPSAEASFIGMQLAISDDGSTLVASASATWFHDFSLLVYERDGAGWSFRQDIDVPGDRETSPDYGQSTGLTISGDGSIIAMGLPSPHYPTPAGPKGLVSVYTRAGAAWSQTAQLSSPDPAAAWSFGVSVDVSADGTTLAVGASARFSQNTGPGNVFIYHASPSGGWGEPTGVDTSGELNTLGERIALSADGRTLLASAIEPIAAPESPPWRGAAYIYEESEMGWRRTARLVDSQPAGWDDAFARWLALSPDGDTAVVGDLATPNLRQLHVYGREAGWGRLTTITPFGGIVETNGPFGGVAASDRDVVVRSVPTTNWTVDVYHRPAGFEVILDPSDRSSSPGVPATFLAASSDTDADVRWQSSSDGGATWADIPGAVYDFYSITPTLADSGRMFRAVFTDGDGAIATTRPAGLHVARTIPVISVSYTTADDDLIRPVIFRVSVASDGNNPYVPSGGMISIEFGGQRFLERVVGGLAVLDLRYSIPPGRFTAVASYDGDTIFEPASTTFALEIPKFDAAFTSRLTIPSPYDGQETRLELRSQTLVDPTGLIVVRASGASGILGVGELGRLPDGSWGVSIPIRLQGSGDRWISWEFLGDGYFSAVTSREISVPMIPIPTAIVAAPTSGSPIHDYREPTTYEVRVRTIDDRPVFGAVELTFPDDVGTPPAYEQVDSDGRAIFRLPSDLAAGGHRAVFRFLGNPRHAEASTTVGVGVYKAPTTVAIGLDSLTADQDSVVTFVARVRDARTSLDPPTSGRVSFYLDGAFVTAVDLGADGTAAYRTSSLSLGPHSVTAVYGESENYRASQSPSVSIDILPNLTATRLTSSRAPATAGGPLEFYADVTSVGGKGRPYGSVRFYVGLTPVAEIRVDESGRATLPARFDVAGNYLMTAVYLGSRTYQTSQSAHLAQVVLPRPSPQVAPNSASPATAASSSASASAVAAEEARPALTPAQARRAALAARPARRRTPTAGRMRR